MPVCNGGLGPRVIHQMAAPTINPAANTRRQARVSVKRACWKKARDDTNDQVLLNTVLIPPTQPVSR